MNAGLAFCLLLLANACVDPSADETAKVPDAFSTLRQAVFSGGGFEGDNIGNTPTGWTVRKYLNNQATPIATTQYNLGLLAVPPQNESDLNLQPNAGGFNVFVVGGSTETQTDPNLGGTASFRYPKFGQRSAVVNPGSASQGPTDLLPTGRNRSANSLSQIMTVTTADLDPLDNQVHIRFVAAPVLQNPSHGDWEQPYFYIEARNVTRGTTLYRNFNFAGQAGVAWKSVGDIQYTDWQLIDIPGGNNIALGDEVELIVYAAGCGRSGHWGRVYVDAFGSSIPGLNVSATAPQAIPRGSNIEYTVTYRNGSNASADNAVIEFTTPPNTVYVSDTGGCTGLVAGATGTLTCARGAVGASQDGSFTITVASSPSYTGVIVAQNYSISATGVTALLGSKAETLAYEGPATLSLVSGTPQDSVVGTPFGAPLVVQVLDANAQPLSGVEVTFSAPAVEPTAVIALSSIRTDNAGLATLPAPTAGIQPGAYQVLASGAGGTISFSLTNRVGPPDGINFIQGQNQRTLATTAFPLPLEVEVTDALGNPISGESVTVTLPSTGPSAVAASTELTTNAQGRASTTIIANAVVGTFSALLQVEGISNPAVAALQNDAIPTTLTLTVTPATPSVEDALTLSAQVSASEGTPTGPVRFVVDGVDIGTGTLSSQSAVLNSSPLSQGPHTLEAFYEGEGPFAPSSASQTLTVGLEGSSVPTDDGGIPTDGPEDPPVPTDDGGILTGGGGCQSTAQGSSFTWLALGVFFLLVLGRRKQGVAMATVLTVAGFSAGQTHAQSTSGVSINTFRPAPAGSDWFQADSLDIRGHFRPSARLVVDYAHNPLVVLNADGRLRTVAISDQVWLNLGGSVVFLDRFRVNLNLPLAVHTASVSGATFAGTSLQPSNNWGLGDVQLGADVRIFGKASSAFTLALGVVGTAPTGSSTSFLGDGRLGLAPRLAMAGRLQHFAWAAETAYAFRRGQIADVAFNNELRFSAAAGWRFAEGKGLLGPEVHGLIDFEGNSSGKRPAALEADFGGHYQFHPQWRGSIGVGSGILRSAGVPDVRVLAGIQWQLPSEAVRQEAPAPEAPAQEAQAPESPKQEAPVQEAAPMVAVVIDSDGDRINDSEDACPNEPGAPSRQASKHGCPGLVRIENGRIVTLAPVNFATDKDVILKSSFPVLEAVSEALHLFPQLEQIAIEGHTDNQGSASYNKRLSQRRSASVMRWLVKSGIQPERLVAAGYGFDRPVADNATPEGRAKNRRVEFIISKQRAEE